MMKHVQSEDVLRRVQAFIGLIVCFILSCMIFYVALAATEQRIISCLIDRLGQRTAIDTDWVLFGDRLHLPRFGELSLDN